MTASLRIEIFPSDRDRTIRFYERLGFVVTGMSDGPPAYASLRLGDVRIGVAESASVEPALRAIPAGTEIVIEVDDLQTYRNDVVGAGIELDSDLQRRPWGLEDFRVFDPDGYYLRFTSKA
jgi:catechol 2,3-dioxygenase-like lactoylglutathione lyase family enzyme